MRVRSISRPATGVVRQTTTQNRAAGTLGRGDPDADRRTKLGGRKRTGDLLDTLSLRRATVRRFTLLREGGIPARRITYAHGCRRVDTEQQPTTGSPRRCMCGLSPCRAETTGRKPDEAALSVPTSEITPQATLTQTTPEKSRQPEKVNVEEACAQPTQQQPEQAAAPPVQEPKSRPSADSRKKKVSPRRPQTDALDRCSPVLRRYLTVGRPTLRHGREADSERRRRCSR